MHITTSILIDAPATEVWLVIGPGFADPARWATSVTTSVGVGPTPTELPGAPHAARECGISGPGASRLLERLTAYDGSEMTLAYIVDEGLEKVARRAVVTWSVASRGPHLSEIRIDTEMSLTLLGRVASPWIRRTLERASRQNAEDLRRFVETGTAAAGGERSAASRSSLTHAVAWNAAFTVLCGGALLGFAPWWADQFGGPPLEVIHVLGFGLVAYGVVLALIARHGASPRIGAVLAALDAGWVVGVFCLLVIAGRSFTGVGIASALATSAAVASFGVLQWAGSRAPSMSKHLPPLRR